MGRRVNYLYICNDNVNSINDVITVLEMVMGYSTYQAEQIALIVHNKGKYPIMKGGMEYLQEFGYILAKHGLTVDIK